MKTLIMLSVLAFATVCNAQVVTFAITSSARTSTPNLRIGFMYGPLPVAPGTSSPPLQTKVISTVRNYFLTKSTAVNMSGPPAVTHVVVQTDQNTKMYVGSDLTNYLLIQSGADFSFAPRN